MQMKLHHGLLAFVIGGLSRRGVRGRPGGCSASRPNERVRHNAGFRIARLIVKLAEEVDMTRQSRLGVVCVALLTGLLSSDFAVPAVAWTSPEAAAAAKASPQLVASLSKEIGGTPDEAAGAAGALFGLAKSRLKADEFSQVSKAVPGMDLLLKAAPAAAAAPTGPAGALSQLAGTVASIPGVASQFSKMGLKPELAPKVASALVSFVTSSGGAGIGTLLASVLK
jgi:hypothetical protein